MERYSVVEQDGEVYGPVTSDDLKQWVAEGRVTRTSIIADSSTGTRGRADTIPGLFPALAEPKAQIGQFIGSMQARSEAVGGLVYDIIAGVITLALAGWILVGGLMAMGAANQAMGVIPFAASDGKVPAPAYILIFSVGGLLGLGGLEMIKSKLIGFVITFAFAGVYGSLMIALSLLSATGMSGTDGVAPLLWAIVIILWLGVFSLVRMTGALGNKPVS